VIKIEDSSPRGHGFKLPNDNTIFYAAFILMNAWNKIYNWMIQPNEHCYMCYNLRQMMGFMDGSLLKSSFITQNSLKVYQLLLLFQSQKNVKKLLKNQFIFYASLASTWKVLNVWMLHGDMPFEGWAEPKLRITKLAIERFVFSLDMFL
jgi:hypothetical protein